MKINLPIRKSYYPGTSPCHIPGKEPYPLIRTWTYKIDKQSNFAAKHPQFTKIANLEHEEVYDLVVKKLSENIKILLLARIISRTAIIPSIIIFFLGNPHDFEEISPFMKNICRDAGTAGIFVSGYNALQLIPEYLESKICKTRSGIFGNTAYFPIFWLLSLAEFIPLVYPEFEGWGGYGATFDPTDILSYFSATLTLYTLDRIGNPEWF
ncbi:MAG: hypothetical protein HQ564_04230 [Candidatus Saganbacteria bacterium]|nr:hypothetical protein [Candidatus Saganbacteria bacterium]